MFDLQQVKQNLISSITNFLTPALYLEGGNSKPNKFQTLRFRSLAFSVEVFSGKFLQPSLPEISPALSLMV